MRPLACPKCGLTVDNTAVICPHCDFIIDASFLEGGPGAMAAAGHKTAPDVVLLGDLGGVVDVYWSDSTGGFLASSTGDFDRRVVKKVPVYVGQSVQVQELLRPEAVLALADDVPGRLHAFSPFERHVMSFIDGERPVARIRKKAGLSAADTKIALAMLADKSAVRLVGVVERPSIEDVLSGILDDDDGAPPTPAATTTTTTTSQPADVQLGPSPPTAEDLVAQAERHEQRGDTKAAIDALRSALVQNPKLADAHNRLGLLLATRLQDYDAAFESVLAAVHLERDNAVYRSNFSKIVSVIEERERALGVENPTRAAWLARLKQVIG